LWHSRPYLLWANSGREQVQHQAAQSRLLDHLVGEREQLVRDHQAQCLGGLEIDSQSHLKPVASIQ
jgi:hypothetical protein